MKLLIHGRNLEITPALRDYTQTKLERATSHFGDAVREAERYAQEFDSHALIVLHKGVVQTEWYADGWDADSLHDSQGMHRTILGVFRNTFQDLPSPRLVILAPIKCEKYLK